MGRTGVEEDEMIIVNGTVIEHALVRGVANARRPASGAQHTGQAAKSSCPGADDLSGKERSRPRSFMFPNPEKIRRCMSSYSAIQAPVALIARSCS